MQNATGNAAGHLMERAAHFATVAGSIISALALGAGVYQFSATQKLTRQNLVLQADTIRQEREAKAIELFLQFNEQQTQLAITPIPKKGDAGFWRRNVLLGTTEAVFTLTRDDSAWGETVAWMLDTQRPFLLSTEFNCATFSQAFLERMRIAAPQLKCQPATH